MDCQTALEILDCVRPDSDDLDLPEMADARAHLESCDACQESFASMQSFDRAVADVVQDVDVPSRLRSALPGYSRRRRAIQAAVSVACALMVGVAVWLQSPTQFTEAELLAKLPINLSANENFDTSFEFALPGPWIGNRQVKVTPEILGIDLDDKAGHDAAVTVFHFSRSRNAPIAGILAAIPASRIAPLPSAVSFAQADSRYIQKDGRRPVAAVWREGDTVYVCLVLGSAADLERIQRNLSTAAA
ncbi:MAG: hypothetical protein ACKVII_28295 [Planctomycetales bacterium]